MKTNQTPQKEPGTPRSAESATRRSKETPLKSISEQVKKPQKISRKCLDSVFTAVTDDLSPEKLESVDSSSISEISDINQRKELSRSFEQSWNPTLSAPSKAIELSDLSPLSKNTEFKPESGDVTLDCNGSDESEDLEPKNVDVEFVVSLLRTARFQVSNASDVDLRSKLLLDAMIKNLMEDFYNFPADPDAFSALASSKVRIGVLVFILLFLWIVSFSASLLSNSGSGRYYPPPT